MQRLDAKQFIVPHKVSHMKLLLVLIGVFSFDCSADDWETPEAFISSTISALNLPSSASTSKDQSGIVWRDSFGNPGNDKKGISVFISKFYVSDENWELIVRNSKWEVIDRISIFSLSENYGFRPSEFWTPNYDSGEITIEVKKKLGTIVSFNITHYSSNIDWPISQSIIDPSDNKIESYEKYQKDPLIDAIAIKVGRILIRNIESSLVESCTGFLVSNNQVITNQHCMSNFKEGESCTGVSIDFSFYSPTEYERFYCKRVAVLNYPLDLARFELVKEVDEFDEALKSSMQINNSDALFFVHHPGGDVKHITFSRCRLSGTPIYGRKMSRYGKVQYEIPQAIYHTCDSLGGSSGGPIVNHYGELVAVHTGGFREGTKPRLNRATLASAASKVLKFN